MGYSFEPRPCSRSLGTAACSVETIGLSINGCSAWKTSLTTNNLTSPSLSSGFSELKGLTLLLSRTLFAGWYGGTHSRLSATTVDQQRYHLMQSERNASARENHLTRERRDAAMREKNFARSTISEEKWGLLVVYQPPTLKLSLSKPYSWNLS